MSDRVPVRVQQDPFPDDWGVERLEPFVEENFVILTSRVEIDGFQQRRYLERNWIKLCTRNARISVVKTYVAHMLKHSICCTFTASCVVVVVVVVVFQF